MATLIATKLAHMRSQVTARLPDICLVLAPNHQPDDAGAWSDNNRRAIYYNSSTDIPCRFDPTRQYRSSDVFGQEAILGDYTVTLPYGLAEEITVDFRLSKNGEEFEVKKVMQDESWAVSTRLLVTKVDA